MACARAANATNGFEIYLVRHGESQINIAMPSGTPREPDDGVRYPLTARGIRQVKALSAVLSGFTPSAIIASTRLRAIQTADAISFATLVPVVPAPEIVEVAIGSPSSGDPQSFDQLYQRWLIEGDLDARMGSGESAAEVERRALPLVWTMIERYRAAAQPLVFVTHGALIALIARHLFDNIDGAYVHANPIVNAGIVRAVPCGARFHCTCWSGKVP